MKTKYALFMGPIPVNYISMISILILLICPVFAAGPSVDNSWVYQFTTDYIHTTKNYDNSGENDAFDTSTAMDYITPKLFVGYNTPELSFFGHLSGTSVSQKTVSTSNSNFGVRGLGAGFNYNISDWILDPWTNLEVEIPFQTLDVQSSETSYSDGAIQVRGGLYFRKQFKQFITSNYIGANFRTAGLSHLLEWKLFEKWKFNRFHFGLGVEGFDSISQDDTTLVGSARKNFLNRANGGSYHFASVNPAAILGGIHLGFPFSKSVLVTADIKQTVWGVRYPNELNVSLGLTLRPTDASVGNSEEPFEIDSEDSPDSSKNSDFEEVN